MNGLLYCLVVVIWGTTWIAIYLQQGPVAAPVSIFWRFAIASTVMIAILLISGKLRKLSGRDHLFCLLQGGCVFCFNFWCFYTAAAWINTGLESVIFSMAVLFNAVNSYLFFGQKPPGRFYVAAGLGLTGIVTLFWQDLVNSGLNHSLLLGIGLSALGTFGFSLGNMISLRHQKKGLEVIDHQQLGDAVRHRVDCYHCVGARRQLHATVDLQLSQCAVVSGYFWFGNRLRRLFHAGRTHWSQ